MFLIRYSAFYGMFYLLYVVAIFVFQVIYDDGDQEILNLKTQKWHFLDESETEVGHCISFISDLFFFVLRSDVTYIFCQQGEEAADQTGHEKEASTE